MASKSYVHSIVGRFEGSKDDRANSQSPSSVASGSTYRRVTRRRLSWDQGILHPRLEPSLRRGQKESDLKNVQDVTLDESISLLDPRRFTPSLHASLVSEILTLRKDQEEKNNLVEELECRVHDTKNDVEEFMKLNMTLKREIHVMKQEIGIMEAESQLAEKVFKEQHVEAQDLNVESKQRLATALDKCRRHEENIERTTKLWNVDKDLWDAEKRKLERHLHVAESRLKTLLAEMTKTEESNRHSIAETGSTVPAGARVSVQSSKSYHRAQMSITSDGSGSPLRHHGISLADELNFESMDEGSDVEEQQDVLSSDAQTASGADPLHDDCSHTTYNRRQQKHVANSSQTRSSRISLARDSAQLQKLETIVSKPQFVDIGTQFTPPAIPELSIVILASHSIEPIAALNTTFSRQTQTDAEETPLLGCTQFPIPSILIRPPTSNTTNPVVPRHESQNDKGCQAAISLPRYTNSVEVQTDSQYISETQLLVDPALETSFISSLADFGAKRGGETQLLPSMMPKYQDDREDDDIRPHAPESNTMQPLSVAENIIKRPYRISGLFSGIECAESSDEADTFGHNDSDTENAWTTKLSARPVIQNVNSQNGSLRRGAPTIRRKDRQIWRTTNATTRIPEEDLTTPVPVPARTSSRKPDHISSVNTGFVERDQYLSTPWDFPQYSSAEPCGVDSSGSPNRFSWQKPRQQSVSQLSEPQSQSSGSPTYVRRQTVTSKMKEHNEYQTLSSSRTMSASEAVSPSPVKATTVVDAIAQTMVGEWMYKYVRRRKSFGISDKDNNAMDKSVPRTRHRRWVWLAPYERTVMWSSKQPSSGTALLGKNGRKLNIQSVLDIKDDNPVPKGQTSIFNRSILILTPTRALKFTAMTQERHYIWLTALSFLARSTEVVTETLQSFSPIEPPRDPDQFDKASFDMPSIPQKSQRRKKTLRDSLPFTKPRDSATTQEVRKYRHGRSSAISKHMSDLSSVINGCDEGVSNNTNTAKAHGFWLESGSTTVNTPQLPIPDSGLPFPVSPKTSPHCPRRYSPTSGHTRDTKPTSPTFPLQSASIREFEPNPIMVERSMRSLPSDRPIRNAPQSLRIDTSQTNFNRQNPFPEQRSSSYGAPTWTKANAAVHKRQQSTRLPNVSDYDRTTNPSETLQTENFFDAIGTVRMEAFIGASSNVAAELSNGGRSPRLDSLQNFGNRSHVRRGSGQEWKREHGRSIGKKKSGDVSLNGYMTAGEAEGWDGDSAFGEF